MVFRILTLLLLPVICLAQVNSNGEKPTGELLSNEVSPIEMKRNALFNLEEIKVRWKKTALENCIGAPCVTTTVPGAPSGVIATLGNASASVAFTAPHDGGSAITGYTVTSIPSATVVTGTFSPIVVTGLMNGTVYTFTVVATNSVGSSVASSASNVATPSACGIISTVQDVDLNSYTTVAIGIQCWIGQNIKTTKYNDGTIIPDESINPGWGSINYGARTRYLSALGYVSTYGYLYNWYAAVGIITGGGSSTKNICPLGWHVPTDMDWTDLTNYLGTNAGGQLKSSSSLWIVGSPSSPGDDQSGFSALPGGECNLSGFFNGIGNFSSFWGATEHSALKGFIYEMSNVHGLLKSDDDNKSFGVSVRCLKD
jgi:uncharacterized protein (TIGR02145 family)